MPPFPDLAERLGDGTIELRLATEYDIPDALIAHQDDPHLYRRLGLQRPPSGAQLGSAYERAPDDQLAGRSLRFTIVAPGGQDCLGQLDVHEVDWTRAQAELGIWVAPRLRGRQLGRRALRLAAGWLFSETALERLIVLTEADNLAMLRAAQAAGFAREAADAGALPGGLIRLTLVARDLTSSEPGG